MFEKTKKTQAKAFVNKRSNCDVRYWCPTTRAPLVRIGEELQTEDGERRYPVRNGIPNFLQGGAIENDETRELLVRLNDIARSDGWQTAIEKVYGARPYVTDERRTNCLDLLGLSNQETVLEIGSSLGQFTPAIANCAKSVYCLEVVAGQTEFAAERCRQEGYTNVVFATGGDDCRLPYANDTFDVVIANLVLEWCFARYQDEPACTVQQRLLNESFRVLRSGGQLYLSTKNRYALRFLIGKQDEHAWDTSFGNALPRWVLSIALKLRGKPQPTGRLYSHNHLKRMLLTAGFESAQSYWAAPEMRHPTHYVPTDATSIRAARQDPTFVQGEFRSTRILMPLVPADWVKFVTPGLLFIAKKGT